jgi:Ran GTPase-activating protein (RanGAP) involved in mRNA processing and transport
LDDNQLGDAGGSALIQSMRLNSTLEVLSLSLNHIGSIMDVRRWNGMSGSVSNQQSPDAIVAAIGEAIQVNGGLRVLYLNKNEFGNRGAISIAAGLCYNTRLQELHLEACNIQGDGCLAIFNALIQNTVLQQLRLNSNEFNGCGEGIGDFVGTNRSLMQLYLRDCKLNDADLSRIARGVGVNSALKSLFLENNLLQGGSCSDWVSAIASNRCLDELSLICNDSDLEFPSLKRLIHAATRQNPSLISFNNRRISREELLVDEDEDEDEVSTDNRFCSFLKSSCIIA